MAWCAPNRCSSLGVSFCACCLPIRHLGNTTGVTPARGRTSASRSVAAMPAPHWFFRFMYDCESAAWERRRDEPEQRELVRRIADELANVVAPPGPVADLGCGPGAHGLALARRGYDVVGVDGSPRMVEVARTRAARDKVDATFDVHDVSAPLRFADASLGGVLAILVVQHLPHPAAFIAEIRRCLRPGGHLLITAPARDSTSLTSQNLYGGCAQRATSSCLASSASTTRTPSLV